MASTPVWKFGLSSAAIRAARQVGNILKYVGPDDPVEPRYANYMQWTVRPYAAVQMEGIDAKTKRS